MVLCIATVFLLRSMRPVRLEPFRQASMQAVRSPVPIPATTENTYGFVRDALGYFTSFEVPDFTYLAVTGINDSDEITGHGDVGAMVLGFVREPEGTIVTFEVPGTTRTLPAAINNARQITAWAFDKNSEG
jgi:hypothetical protein